MGGSPTARGVLAFPWMSPICAPFPEQRAALQPPGCALLRLLPESFLPCTAQPNVAL